MDISKLQHARVIVTGGTGFIGANLIARLIGLNATVFAPIRPHSNLWRLEGIKNLIHLTLVDLADFKATEQYVKNIDPHFIFHLAVDRDTVNWRSMIDTNIIVTIHLLKASAFNSNIKFIHTGSATEYGNVDMPCEESARIKPNTLYGCSKAAGSQFVMQATEENLLRGVVARMFYVYGYQENGERFIPTAIKSILREQAIAVTENAYHHDFIFIEDVIDFLITAATNDNAVGHIFNIGTGVQWDNLQLIAMIGKILNIQPKIKHGAYSKKEYDRENWVADIKLAKERLKWTPKHDVLAGLVKTIAWIKANEFQGTCTN